METMTKPSVYETLSVIDMGAVIKQNYSKQNYIPWGEQWNELLKHYPDSKYKVRQHDHTGLPFFASPAGTFVCVEVTVDGITREQWHTCLDAKQKAIINPSTKEINNAIQRALAKCVALFGLGLYLYKGDDYPSAYAEPSSVTLASGQQSDEFYDLCNATETDPVGVVAYFCANVFRCQPVANFEQLSEGQAQEVINGLIAKKAKREA